MSGTEGTVLPRIRLKTSDNPVDSGDEPRKRQKRVDSPSATALGSKGSRNETVYDDPGHVVELGKKLLDTIENERDDIQPKRFLSTNFMKLPNKRQYPDYYRVIRSPICLEEIRSNLEVGFYPNFEALYLELEHCFGNAKLYNAPGSLIYIDAKKLMKVTQRKYNELASPDEQVEVEESGSEEEEQAPEEQDEEDEEDEEEEEFHPKANTHSASAASPKPHKKKPAFYPQIKARLEKLLWRTRSDDPNVANGYFSDMFMELPPKKLYPDYYLFIKKPMSFDIIEKKIKKQQYSDAYEFMADVELVFSNCELYNEPTSGVVADAKALRAIFADLMKDIAPKEEAGAASMQSGPKIKLKLNNNAVSTTPPTVASPVPSPIVAPAASSPAPASAQQQIRFKPVVKTEPPKPEIVRPPPPPPARAAPSVLTKPSFAPPPVHAQQFSPLPSRSIAPPPPPVQQGDTALITKYINEQTILLQNTPLRPDGPPVLAGLSITSIPGGGVMTLENDAALAHMIYLDRGVKDLEINLKLTSDSHEGGENAMEVDGTRNYSLSLLVDGKQLEAPGDHTSKPKTKFKFTLPPSVESNGSGMIHLEIGVDWKSGSGTAGAKEIYDVYMDRL